MRFQSKDRLQYGPRVGFARFAKAAAFGALATVAGLGMQASQLHASNYGGTFIKAMENEPATLDYLFGKDITALTVMANIYSPLIRLDYDFRPQPELAESWDVSADGLRYQFNLRKDVMWTDGTNFTAHDVVFTLNEMTCPMHNRSKSWCPRVASFEAADDHTFVINMNEPFAPLLTIIADHNSGTLIRPRHVFEQAVDKDNPQLINPTVSTGGFKFGEWVRGSHIELVRNENYFKEGLPYLDRVIIQFLPDEAGRMAALLNGDIDMLHSYILPYERVNEFRADPRFDIVEHGNEATGTNENLLLNHDNEYLQHKLVRQAVAVALNKPDIAEAAMFGASPVTEAHIHPGVSWVYFPEFDYPYDPELANQMAGRGRFSAG